MQDHSKLIQTISAKICHDFAGPMGAISSCADMLSDKSEWIRAQAEKILVEESRNIVKNIQICRFIFGYNNKDELIESKSIAEYYQKLSLGKREQVKLQITDTDQSFNINLVKALFCLAQIEIETLLNKKDSLEIIFTGKEMKLIVNSQSLQENNQISALLANPNHEITSYNCRVHYILLLCKENGKKIQLKQSGNKREYKIN